MSRPPRDLEALWLSEPSTQSSARSRRCTSWSNFRTESPRCRQRTRQAHRRRFQPEEQRNLSGDSARLPLAVRLSAQAQEPATDELGGRNGRIGDGCREHAVSRSSALRCGVTAIVRISTVSVLPEIRSAGLALGRVDKRGQRSLRASSQGNMKSAASALIFSARGAHR